LPLAEGAGFCTSCGAKAPSEVDAGPGYVVDGHWHKAPGEFVRRVALNEMAGAFDRLAREGGLLDGVFGRFADLSRQVIRQLEGRNIVVPQGAIGIVVVDGRVTDVLPPGRQTTLGWFRGFAERLREQGGMAAGWKTNLARMGSAAADHAADSLTGRTSFYLLDRRPVPVAFMLEVPGAAPGQRRLLQVLCSVQVAGGGSNRAALAAFLQRVVGERTSLSAQDLYRTLRAEVERTVRGALDRHGAGARPDFAEAERAAQKALSNSRGRETGLRFDITIAPRSTTISLDLHLGQDIAPYVRPCVAPSCDAEIGTGQRFCTTCGTAQPAGNPAEEQKAELLSADPVPVELDLILRCQGEGDVADTSAVESAVTAAAARVLRGMSFEQIASADGFAAVVEAVESDAEHAVQALGMRFLDIAVLDVRSHTAGWVMNARADMERARQAVLVGREWLEVEASELDLQELSLDLVLRQRQIQLDHEFEIQAQSLEDQKRRDELDLADARRAGAQTLAMDEQTRDVARTLTKRAHADTLEEQTRAAEAAVGARDAELAATDHQGELARRALELESEQARRRADDGAHAARAAMEVADEGEQRRWERERQAKADERAHDQAEWDSMLRAQQAIADQERARAQDEQAHVQALRQQLEGKSEAEILAIQATELAKAQHGDAFAQALSKLGDQRAERAAVEADHARQSAEQQAKLYERMLATQDTAAERAASTADRAMQSMAEVAAAAATGPQQVVELGQPGAAPGCVQCGRPLLAPYAFCGDCGTRQGS